MPEPDHFLGPSGERYDDAGAAPAVESPALSASGAADLLVAKRGRVFVCCGPDGDIDATVAAGHGVFADDTRFLSRLQLTVGGRPCVPLTSSDERGNEVFIHLTNGAFGSGGAVVPS